MLTKKTAAFPLCVALLLTAPVSADVVMMSMADNVGVGIGGLTDLADIDVFSYNTTTDTGAIVLETPDFDIGGGDTNAVHYLPNGNIVISNLFNGSLAGVPYEDDDLLEYNPNTDTATLLFDGSTKFDATGEDIDGIYIRDNGNFVMSTINDAGLGGLSFGEGDIIDYNPTTDIASLLVAETAIFDDGGGDIDAIHVLPNGNLLLSALADTETVSGVDFNDGDVFEYDPVQDTATLYLGESVFTSTGAPNDINAFTLVPEPGTFGLLLLSMGFVMRRRTA